MQVSVIATFQNSTSVTQEHMHADWELTVWTYGNGTATIDGTCVPVDSSTVLLIPAGTEHSESFCEEESYRVICIRFRDEGMLKGLSHIRFTDDTSGTVRNMAECANRLYVADPVKNKRAVELIIEAICTVITESCSANKLSDGITMLRDEINKCYTDPEFKVAECITRMGYNPDYMRRLFKTEMGITPTDMLIEKRIENAKKLLSTHRYPELTVSEIAYSCGFYDSNYFTRVFKKETGILPTAYRKGKR